ncbi:MAG: MgtC/SapB family protein [Methyloglobulus sp.]|nr:MgtC/SapB family protein [Methyloglobulus sp.]
MWEIISQELSRGLPDTSEFIRVSLRLILAMILGGIIGMEREQNDKPAGLRTHILVAMGSALFVIVPLELGISMGEISRTVQGVATGIGFLGAGAIVKQSATDDVKGLTTAAGIWLTAGVGVALGLGSLGIALLAVLLTWVTLAIVGYIKLKLEAKA